MKIVIDASQQESHITGTDRLAHNVLKELQRTDTTNQYSVICTYGYEYIPMAVTGRNYLVVRQRLFRGYKKILIMPLRLIRLLKRKYLDKPDLFFSFLNLSSPRIKFSPVVSHALDVVPLVYADQYHSNRLAYLRYRSRLKHTIKLADGYIAISDYTKRDLVDRLGIEPSKIHVVHLAAEPKFKRSTPELLEAARSKYGLPEEFVLSIGANEPRKNVAGVIEAYKSLPPNIQTRFPLVVLGKAWRKNRIEEMGLEMANVLFTGYVEDDDLPAVYSLASVFVFLSLYEGFGLPILEAMGCGTPVVCSDNSSLPEVAGQAAIMVKTEDTSQAAGALKTVLSDQKLRDKMSQASLSQASKFSWQKTAEQYHDILIRYAKS